MKSSLALVGLNESFVSQLARTLSDELNMFYANVREIIEYEVFDAKEIEKKCGLEYLNNLRQKSFKNIVEYENAIIDMPFSVYSYEFNSSLISKNAIVIYVCVDKSLYEKSIQWQEKESVEVQKLAYENRHQFCTKHADIIVEMNNLATKQNVNKIKKQLLLFMSSKRS